MLISTKKKSVNFLQAYQAEQDIKLRQKMEEMDMTNDTLTKKILNEGIESVLPKHPFYKCLQNKTLNLQN